MAVALVCVGVSLILGGQYLGFVPDVAAIKQDARQNLCETIAINAAAQIRKQQWLDLKTTLQTLVDRNPDLLSVGVRSDLGVLRVDTGHHADIWDSANTATETEPTSDTLAAAESSSRRSHSPSGGAEARAPWEQTAEQKPAKPAHAATTGVQSVKVPIMLHRRQWGCVELCFRDPTASGFIAALSNHSLGPLIAFFVVAGMCSYSFLMARVMGVFRGTQVVPDRVRQALDTLAEGLLVLDEDGRIVLANRAFAETVGTSGEELARVPASDLAWIQEDEDFSADFPWTLSIQDSQVRVGSMLRYRLANNQECIFSVNAAPLGGDGSQRGALVTFRDVTHIETHRIELEKMLSMLRSSRDEVRRKNRELEILATKDSLTNCLNRRAFFERFETYWKQADADDTPLACIMIDIDHFKSVNDDYGHHTGDEVLRQVSAVLRRLHESRSLLCRYGGEEFCIVMPETDLETVLQEAEEIRLEIGKIRFSDPAELKLTASLGVSELRFDPSDPQDLINQADSCLYIAKRNGRNQVVAYDPSYADLDIDDSAISRTRAEDEPDRVDIPFQAVTALVSALCYRDSATAEHSRRVADLSVRAADGLLDQRQTYVLEIASLLHDIGKIGVPDHVLLKPGKLTPEEWDLMNRHDRIGVEMIAGTFQCPELSETIRTHHAYFGGGGHHADLPTGASIPITARLLTIADSYDAMVSDRVYRKGRSPAEAVTELRRCAGTQFDPELVEHFAAKILENNEASRSLAGSIPVPKQTALAIGLQIERLADAIDQQDTSSLKTLASRLGMVAKHYDIPSIATVASKIEAHANTEETQWIDLLGEAQSLMQLCRATQNAYIAGTTEYETPRETA